MFKDLETKNSDLLNFVLEQLLNLLKNPDTGYISRRQKELIANQSGAPGGTPQLSASNDDVTQALRTHGANHIKMPSLELPPSAQTTPSPIGDLASSTDSLEHEESDKPTTGKPKPTTGKPKKKKSKKKKSAEPAQEMGQVSAQAVNTTTTTPQSASVESAILRVASSIDSPRSEPEQRTLPEVSLVDRAPSNGSTSASVSSDDSVGARVALFYSWAKLAASSRYKGIDTVALTKEKVEFAQRFVQTLEDFGASQRVTKQTWPQIMRVLKDLIEQAQRDLIKLRAPYAANSAQLDALLNVFANSVLWLEDPSVARFINNTLDADQKLAQASLSATNQAWMKSISELTKILFVLKLDEICMCETNSGQIRMVNDPSRNKLSEKIVEKLDSLLDTLERTYSDPELLAILATNFEAISWHVHKETQAFEKTKTIASSVVNAVSSALSLSSGIDRTDAFLQDFASFLDQSLQNIERVMQHVNAQNTSPRKFSLGLS